MFWTGDAPTVPGIKVKFSKPAKFCATQYNTKSFQTSAAPASTNTSSSCSHTVIPLIPKRITRPSKSLVNNKLLPPPKTNNSFCLQISDAKTDCSSAIFFTSTKYFAFTAILKVLKGSKEIFS